MWRPSWPGVAAVVIILLGMTVRIDWMNQTAMWCDEAESSINGLTILETGLPGWKYMGLPVYENTLTQPWDGHPEYEFRDSTYSHRGLVVYHGWLPLYAIAASQALCGMTPDRAIQPPSVQHGPEETDFRTIVPRLPALVFSLGFLIVIYRLGTALGGPAAGLGALTLMAFNARTVDFGFQARYYSATLFFTALAAWFLWRVVRRGWWRDFLGLGIVAGLLFHTHLFSTLVFALVAGVLSPAIMRKERWLAKSAAGAGLSTLLALPWILFTGFLDTASRVPKVYTLFDQPLDALAYMLDRPVPLLIVAAVALLTAAALWRPAWLPGRIQSPLRDHGTVYLVLLLWMAFAYAAFHLIIPAASFFVERLTLMLWVPFVLVLSLFVSDLLKPLRPSTAAVVAVMLMLGFLGARGRLAFFESSSIPNRRPAMAELTGVLADMGFSADAKIYAVPNEHLTLTYYTGLPVQSVAPVRREFLETYPGEIVYIEKQFDATYPNAADVVAAAQNAGVALDEESIHDAAGAVWTYQSARDLESRGLTVAAEPALDPWLETFAAESHARFLDDRDAAFEFTRSHPVFRSVGFETIRDSWLSFFYRFVEPESRIGDEMNILPRLRNASTVFVPNATTNIFISESPSDAGH